MKKKYQPIKSDFKLNVLVVTENFPLLNQSWIDTYIEQLILNSFSVIIYSSNKKPGKYGKKVNDLDLRKFVSSFNIAKCSAFADILKSLIFRPKLLFNSVINAWKINNDIVNKYKIKFFPSFLKLIRFGIVKKKFILWISLKYLKHRGD